MSRILLKRILAISILFLFIFGVFIPGLSVVSKEIQTHDIIDDLDEKVVSCYVFDKRCNSDCEVVLSSDDYNKFISMFEELNFKISYEPFSKETMVLKSDFIDLVDDLGFIFDV